MWTANVNRLSWLLEQLAFQDQSGERLDTDLAFERWTEWTRQIHRTGSTVYLIGNGASASMASHFAADLAKNGQLHTQVFSDICLVTAISNDISFEQVYAEPLRRRGRPGDLLVAISSSGRSPNILRCVEVARELGIIIVTLSAFGADNPLRSAGDLNGYIPAATYGEAETCHAAVLHSWMDTMEVNT